MSSLNRVMLIGNLGRDPETRTFQSGGKVCNFSMATSERWKDKNTGEQRERTQWHNIAVFNEHLVRIAEQYLQKGSKVFVEGQMETRKWQDQNGNDRYTTEVVLRPFNGTIVMLGEKGENSGSQSQSGTSYNQDRGRTPPHDPIDDDSIPF